MAAQQDLWGSRENGLLSFSPDKKNKKKTGKHTLGLVFLSSSLKRMSLAPCIECFTLHAYPLYDRIVRQLCFKVKCFSCMEVYREQSSSRFITSRRQSSFCRAPWQHGIALFPPAFVGGCQAARDKVHCLHKYPAILRLYESYGLTCQNQITNLRGTVTFWNQTQNSTLRILRCVCLNHRASLIQVYIKGIRIMHNWHV